MIHTLFVAIIRKNDVQSKKDTMARQLTLDLIHFVRQNLPVLDEMGIVIVIERVDKKKLQDPRVRNAMKSAGLASLPALRTSTGIYLGNEEIKGLYMKNIEKFYEWKTRSEAPLGGMSAEDDLASYYKNEMTMEKATADHASLDDVEDINGENDDMMGAYRKRMRGRENGSHDQQTQSSSRHVRPAVPMRANNVRQDQTSSMQRMMGHSDNTTEDQGGNELFDTMSLDHGGNTKDDLMERAWLENQEDSMGLGQASY